MGKNDKFVVWLPCKPYVRQYLINNYIGDGEDDVVDLRKNSYLHNDFVSRLTKDGRWEKKYSNLYRYKTMVAVRISRDEFYRYGFSLANSEVVSFGLILERNIKNKMFLYVDLAVGMGMQISVAIRRFQKNHGFDEDSWPYETIRRIYNRHSRDARLNQSMSIYDFIDKNIMGKLSHVCDNFPC